MTLSGSSDTVSSHTVAADWVVHLWWPGFVGLTYCGVTMRDGLIARDLAEAFAFHGVEGVCPVCAAAARKRAVRRRG